MLAEGFLGTLVFRMVGMRVPFHLSHMQSRGRPIHSTLLVRMVGIRAQFFRPVAMHSSHRRLARCRELLVLLSEQSRMKATSGFVRMEGKCVRLVSLREGREFFTWLV